MSETETYFNIVVQSMHKASLADNEVEIAKGDANALLDDQFAEKLNHNELEIRQCDHKVALLIGVMSYSNLKKLTDDGPVRIYHDIKQAP